MEKKIRRTLHQVWCDQADAHDKGIEVEDQTDPDYVWYQHKIYKVNKTHYTGEYFLHSIDGQDVMHMDVDMIHENCYEAFENEYAAHKVLYG